MKKSILLIIILYFSKCILHAQLWTSVQGGCTSEVRDFLSDSSSNLLYAVGSFQVAGGVIVRGVATWHNANWAPVGGGTGDTLNLMGGVPILSIAKYGQDLFVGGMMGTMEGDRNIKFLSRWDGTKWDACGRPTAPVNLEVTNGLLFAMGGFDSIGGRPIGGIATWDGQEWVGFGDSLHWGFGDQLWCSEFYQGEYYFGGNMDHPGGLNEIIRWDGDHWKPLGTGIAGDPWINDITVYKDQLFVGGEFHTGDGNPASYLMAWDGTQWYDPFPEVQYTTQVKNLEVIDGVLYIVGNHYVWDGSHLQGLHNLAKYDGENFCSFGGLYNWCLSIAGYQNELYVSTGEVINPFGADPLFPNGRDTMNFIAKWIGGDSVDICVSQPVRVSDPVVQELDISLFPNPVQSSFQVGLPQGITSCQIRILDIAGREVVGAFTYHTGAVDVAQLSKGLYLVEVSAKGRRQVIKLVME